MFASSDRRGLHFPRISAISIGLHSAFRSPLSHSFSHLSFRDYLDMTPSSTKRDNEESSQRPRKRAKYTQVAWCVQLPHGHGYSEIPENVLTASSNECKRRKLKCSGGDFCVRCARDNVPCIYAAQRPIASTPEIELKDDQCASPPHV